MLSFEPSEEQRLMRDAVGDFARTLLAPRARELEAMGGVPPELRRAAFELGLATLELPEEVGGQGAGPLSTVLVEEELGRSDGAAATALAGAGAFGTAVLELAPADRHAALLAAYCADGGHERFGAVAWSELRSHAERSGMCTTAEPSAGGWVLRGHKAFVHNAGLARELLVFAQVAPERGWDGLGGFVVPADAPGVSVGSRHRTLGLDCAWFGDVAFDGVALPASARLVPSEGSFAEATLRFFARRSLVVAARALGVARAAYELARDYCDLRVAFGKPIGHFQAVAFTLADRHMDVESARWLLWRAAWHWQSGAPERAALRATAQAVAHVLEVAMRTADDCVSLHGGIGFVRDLVAEKLMRDAKQLALCCLTPAMLDQLATAVDVGAPLAPSLVLPTPDAQAIFVC